MLTRLSGEMVGLSISDIPGSHEIFAGNGYGMSLHCLFVNPDGVYLGPFCEIPLSF